jgi:hypothetical protein
MSLLISLFFCPVTLWIFISKLGWCAHLVVGLIKALMDSYFQANPYSLYPKFFATT